MDQIDRVSLSPGSRIGQFELIDTLGQGSFALVWEAVDLRLQRNVAIKFPRPPTTEEQFESFLCEARRVAALKHPGIVEIYEVSAQKENPYLVLELVDGVTLRQWCQFVRPNYRQIADLVLQAARAIDHAHQNGIIHQDIKPENILVDLQGNVKITDFGLARRVEGSLGERDQAVGTVAYMSPEQASVGSSGPSSDLFSLGVVLFELLTSGLPFSGMDKHQYLASLASGDAAKCRAKSPRTPSILAAICDKCLRQKSELRYESVAELAEELDRFICGKVVQVDRWNAVQLARAVLVRRNVVLALFGIMIAAIGAMQLKNRWFDAERAKLLVRSLSECDASHLDDAVNQIALHSGLGYDFSITESDKKPHRLYFGKLAVGENCIPSLLSRLDKIPEAECLGLVTSLRHYFRASHDIDSMSSYLKSDDSLSTESRLRLAILIAHFEGSNALLEYSRFSGDPSNVTDLIDCLARFNCGVLVLSKWLEDAQDTDLQFVLALAIGAAQDDLNQEVGLIVYRRLREVASITKDAGVHSATVWALKQCGSFNSDGTQISDPWAIVPRDLQQIGMDFVKMNENERTNPGKSAFISRSEVPHWLFAEYATSRDWPEKMEWVELRDERRSPARYLPLAAVPHFCNWLSRRCNRTPCYEVGEELSFGNYEQWKTRFDCDGFRLPTETEWEREARAGSEQDFYWGTKADHFNMFVSDSEQLLSSAVSEIESKMPNRFGLFDVLGNVDELCHGLNAHLIKRGGHKYVPREQCRFSAKGVELTQFDRLNPSLGLRLVVGNEEFFDSLIER